MLRNNHVHNPYPSRLEQKRKGFGKGLLMWELRSRMEQTPHNNTATYSNTRFEENVYQCTNVIRTYHNHSVFVFGRTSLIFFFSIFQQCINRLTYTKINIRYLINHFEIFYIALNRLELRV